MYKLVRRAALGAVALAAVSAGVLVPTTAQAAIGDMSCVSGEACAWKNANYDTPFIDMHPTDSNWTDNVFGNGTNVNDAVSSGGAIDRAIRYYQHANFKGWYFTLGVTQFDPVWSTNQQLSNNPGFNFNDQVSSSAIYVPL